MSIEPSIYLNNVFNCNSCNDSIKQDDLEYCIACKELVRPNQTGLENVEPFFPKYNSVLTSTDLENNDGVKFNIAIPELAADILMTLTHQNEDELDNKTEVAKPIFINIKNDMNIEKTTAFCKIIQYNKNIIIFVPKNGDTIVILNFLKILNQIDYNVEDIETHKKNIIMSNMFYLKLPYSLSQNIYSYNDVCITGRYDASDVNPFYLTLSVHTSYVYGEGVNVHCVKIALSENCIKHMVQEDVEINSVDMRENVLLIDVEEFDSIETNPSISKVIQMGWSKYIEDEQDLIIKPSCLDGVVCDLKPLYSDIAKTSSKTEWVYNTPYASDRFLISRSDASVQSLSESIDGKLGLDTFTFKERSCMERFIKSTCINLSEEFDLVFCMPYNINKIFMFLSRNNVSSTNSDFTNWGLIQSGLTYDIPSYIYAQDTSMPDVLFTDNYNSNYNLFSDFIVHKNNVSDSIKIICIPDKAPNFLQIELSDYSSIISMVSVNPSIEWIPFMGSKTTVEDGLLSCEMDVTMSDKLIKKKFSVCQNATEDDQYLVVPYSYPNPIKIIINEQDDVIITEDFLYNDSSDSYYTDSVPNSQFSGLFNGHNYDYLIQANRNRMLTIFKCIEDTPQEEADLKCFAKSCSQSSFSTEQCQIEMAEVFDSIRNPEKKTVSISKKITWIEAFTSALTNVKYEPNSVFMNTEMQNILNYNSIPGVGRPLLNNVLEWCGKMEWDDVENINVSNAGKGFGSTVCQLAVKAAIKSLDGTVGDSANANVQILNAWRDGDASNNNKGWCKRQIDKLGLTPTSTWDDFKMMCARNPDLLERVFYPCACSGSDPLWDVYIQQYIEWCSGDIQCEEYMKTLDPYCIFDYCKSNSSTISDAWKNNNNCGDLTINNCNLDIEGSAVQGDVSCEQCTAAGTCKKDNESNNIMLFIIIGVVVGVIILAIVLFFLFKKKKVPVKTK
jgi:hypothetical protein